MKREKLHKRREVVSNFIKRVDCTSSNSFLKANDVTTFLKSVQQNFKTAHLQLSSWNENDATWRL